MITIGIWILAFGFVGLLIFLIIKRQFGTLISLTATIGIALIILGQIGWLRNSGITVREFYSNEWPLYRLKPDGRVVITTTFNDTTNPWLWVALPAGKWQIEARGTIDIYKDAPDLRFNRMYDFVSPAGTQIVPVSGRFPYAANPCALVARTGRYGEIFEVGYRHEITLNQEAVVGFSMNDDVLKDNGGEGWTIIVTPIK